MRSIAQGNDSSSDQKEVLNQRQDGPPAEHMCQHGPPVLKGRMLSHCTN